MSTPKSFFISSKIWHIAFSLLVFCLFIFLSVRATDRYRWSDWGFGDAQTMLSLRQWEEEGWLANKFLFIPQGYTKVVHFFDEPELRQHAHGICPTSSPGIGPRLWYTHYPSGYLIPYAILFRMGLDNIFFIRMLSICFSIGAFILMYFLFSKITSPYISFLAVFFYGLSTAFLGYADSLANQPIDDLLRFSFMFAVVLSTQAISLKQRKVWMFSAWVIEFLLSLSSFDSVFFVYLWLVGWDLLEHRGFRWKTYLIYATAPLLAHSLQFLQNVWYLGLNDAILDIKETFLVKSGPWSGHSRFIIIWQYLVTLFYNLYRPVILLVSMVIFYSVYNIFLKEKEDKELPSFGLLGILFLCGLALGFILPYGTIMPYEIRQFAPFTALLIGGATRSFIKELFSYSVKADYKKGKRVFLKKEFRLLYLLLFTIVIFSFWYCFAFTERRPVYNVKGHPDILLAEKIKSMPTKFEVVIFDIGGFQKFWKSVYVPGYPQIHPITEYYAQGPILCFTEPKDLAADLLYMIRKSPYKSSPILISRDLTDIEKVISILNREGALKQMPPQPYTILDRYVLVLTDYLK